MSRHELDPQRGATGWVARHHRLLQAVWAVCAVASATLVTVEVAEEGWSQQAAVFLLTLIVFTCLLIQTRFIGHNVGHN